MNHNTNEDIRSQAADIAAAIRNLKPNQKHRKNQLFSLLYPAILEMMAKSVTQKSILELLEAKGLKLHASRFKELLEIERKAANNQDVIKEGQE